MTVLPPAGAVAPLTGPAAPQPINPAPPGPFREQLARAVAAHPVAEAVSPSTPVRAAASEVVHRAMESQRHLDRLIAQARCGRTCSPQELIALQARVYRHAADLELFGKAVEQVSAAVKQTLGTQV